MSLVYTIQVAKDHAQVTATWNITVDNPELITRYRIVILCPTPRKNISDGPRQRPARQGAEL
jgi:hypothetical protein